ncbi:MAG: hypothetical protein SVR94_15165 [Pseudomonadota bacterium]|nr:hypothetical protein [Pseudomonadota bacterium]
MNNNIFLNKLVIQFLLICSLLAWGVKTLAVEPSITLAKGISLLLRDDGVLIQLGGYPTPSGPFIPLTLEANVLPPIQSQRVVLTQIERVELQDGLPEYSDSSGSKEDSVIAYHINGDVFIWHPIVDSLMAGNWYEFSHPQPKGKVEGLSSVKKILMNQSRPYLALTQTHAVFSFGGFRNIPLSPLTELNDVKTLVLERQGYRVLTSKGSLLSASIDEKRVYYTTPTPLTDESGTVITHLSQLSDFYKPYQSSLLTQEGYTYLINWMDDYPNRIYKNMVWLVKDEQGNPIPNITRISRGFTSFFAFTEEGTAYVWQSNFGSSTYSPAYLIKDKQGVALSPVIDAVFGGEAKYFMLTANGQLYFVKHEPFKNFSPSPPPDAPSAATLVHDLEGNILSNVNALNSRFITTEAGEVYFRLDEVEGVDFRVQKIEGLEDIKLDSPVFTP